MGVRSEGGYLQHRLPAHTRPHGISRDANTWMHIIFFLTNAHKNKHAHTREERNRYSRRHTQYHNTNTRDALYPLTVTITTSSTSVIYEL